MNAFHRNKTVHFICALALLVLSGATNAQVTGNAYQQRSLVSDGGVSADNTDANLVNGWGIAFNPFGPVWVADNGTGTSTLYDGTGQRQPLVVTIPPAGNATGNGKPTGIVFNGSPTGFEVSANGVTAPSRFVFATEDGSLAGWAPTVDMTNAIRVVDNSANGAVYKGLALSAGGNGGQLYAADFHNNRVDVFDSSFKPVTLQGGAFVDPGLPAGFAPFGIQSINGDIYVTYAMRSPDSDEDVPGPGMGYVSVFKPTGELIRRVASQGTLNAPWGIALAPAGFGQFSNRLLIGNFGDGTINAFDAATGDFIGTLAGTDQQPIKVDGLWGIAFGNGFANQPVDTLFFAAGPNEEQNGLYGRIDVAQ
jgi:uncharacterized protein (TIGR03118 family)